MNGTTGKAGITHQPLGDILVHRDGRAGHRRTHERHVRQFKRALHGSVLSVRPVQDREYYVEARDSAASRLVTIAPHETASAAWYQCDLRRVVGDYQRGGAASRAVTGIADTPATILRDADQGNLMTVGVQGSKDVGG
jgi:hypothetical protein